MKKTSLGSIFLALVLVLVLGGTLCAQSKTITLRGDVWPPYVMDPSDGKQGFMVDVAIAALGKAGYTVAYENAPWTRALDDATAGKIDGVVGIYFSDAKSRNFVLPGEEIGISVNKFYVPKDSTWTYTGLASLDKIILGTIKDYDYGEVSPYIDSQVKANSKKVDVMFGDKVLENNLNKLLAGRIGATLDDQLVIAYVAGKMGIFNKIKEAGIAPPTNKVGVAFSPKNTQSAAYAKALADGIIKLRASGELKKILDKYGVKDWK
jgi:polar amino acid transport system substrate-binding protein